MLRLHDKGLGPFRAVACLTFIERDALGPCSSSIMGQRNDLLGLFSGCRWSFHHKLFFKKRQKGRKEKKNGWEEERKAVTVITCIWGAFGAFPAHRCHLIFRRAPPGYLLFSFHCSETLANLLKDMQPGKRQPWKLLFYSPFQKGEKEVITTMKYEWKHFL